MEIKLVNLPIQDENTHPELIQYPGEKWCVQVHMFRESLGGYQAWVKHLKEIKPSVVYLYDIKALDQVLTGAGVDENGQPINVQEIIYYIRADYKK